MRNPIPSISPPPPPPPPPQPSSRLLRSLLISAFISSPLVSQVYASSQFSFFEHTSCNVGTSFYQITDPNPIKADLNCHQAPDLAVAMYISDIDKGCTLRTYTSSTCDPTTLTGVLLSAGTCFYMNESSPIGSYRADCVGIAYTDSNGEDHGNSYSPSSGDDAEIVDLLATATGPVTIPQTTGEITKTVIPVRGTESATATPTGAAVEETSTGSATSSAAKTGMSSLSNSAARQRGAVAVSTSAAGLVLLAVAGFLGKNALF